MSTVRFLCDEAVAVFLAGAVHQQEPAVEISCVGQDGMPRKGTLDPELLIFAEAMRWCLLTVDRQTMASHVADHQAAGNHTWGVFSLRDGFPVIRHVDNLILIWSASQAEEWIDHMDWLPWEMRSERP